ncbi:MAG: GNAT family N-acetyltransferase [Firmicutes bacterium]|nr:GNAT family N-acetyltransferase [Bacillota bacterium]
MPLVIRAAKEEDLPSLLALYAELDGDEGRVLGLDEARAIFARLQRYPNYRIYLAILDGEVVGSFALLIMDNLAHHGAPSGIVEDLVVEAAYRGRGIGRQMMEYAFARCKEAGCYKMALSSNLKREAAHGFYERLGFKKHGYSFIVEL